MVLGWQAVAGGVVAPSDTPPPALLTRIIVPQPDADVSAIPAVEAPAPAAVTTAPPAAAPRATANRAAARPPVHPAPADPAVPGPAAVAEAEPVPTDLIVPVVADAQAQAAAAQADIGDDGPPVKVPHYRTRAPASVVLNYRLSRGPLEGQGALAWELDGARYQLRLSGEVALFGTVLTQVSTGVLDPHGLAPTRYTDQRRGKAALAVNFQREAGKISFSGPSHEYALVDGVQDRLSWMVQLAAIAQADPSRIRATRSITLAVAGPRGDLDTWVFVSDGPQSVEVGGQPVMATKLVRQPRKPRDTGVEVWLDPSRQYLPARARLSDGGRESLDLHLQP